MAGKGTKAAGPEGQAPGPVWRSLPGSSACVPQARGRIHPLSPQAGPGRDFWGPSSSFPKGKGLQEQLGSRTAPAGGRASSSVLGGKQSPGEGKEVRSLRSPQLPSLPSSSCLSPACLAPCLTSLPLRVSLTVPLHLCLSFYPLALPLPLFLCLSVSRASLSLTSSCLSPSLNGCVCAYVAVCLLACFSCGCLSGSLLPPVSASLAVCFPLMPPVQHTHCLSIPAGTGCGWTAARRCLVAWTSVLSRLSTAKMAEITS